MHRKRAASNALNFAFETALKAYDMEPDNTNIGKALQVLAKKAGIYGMIGGQVIDLINEDNADADIDSLMLMDNLKTGALIEAACVMGCIVAEADEAKKKAAAEFAKKIGLAFQIRDDMLDVIGTQEEMGKGVGTDASKNIFVRLYGLEKCEELVQKYTQAAIDALDCFENTDYMIALAKSLTDRRV